MAAAAAVIAIGLPGDMRLRLGDRFDRDIGRAKQIVEATARDRIAAAVDHDRGFKKGRRGDTAFRGVLDCRRVNRGIGFVAQDRDQRRAVNNHAAAHGRRTATRRDRSNGKVL